MKHRIWATITVAAFVLGWGLGRSVPPWEREQPARTQAPDAADIAPAVAADGSAAARPGGGARRSAHILGPEDWSASLARLDVLARQGDGSATEALRQALLDSIMQVARDGDVRLARSRLEAYLARNPHDPDAHLMGSDLLQMQGRAVEAVDPLLALLRFADDPEVVSRARDKLELLVNAREAHLGNTGKIPALIRFLEELTLRDPSFDGHRLRLAHWQLRAGRAAAAERTLTETGTVGADPQAREDLLEQVRLARTGLPLVRHGGSLHVTARVGGKPLRLLVDTGASKTALTRAGAAGLGAVPTGTRVSVRTANGVVTSEVHRVTRVEIGELELDSLSVLVLEGPLPQGVDGLLGMDVLSRFSAIPGTGPAAEEGR